MTSPHDDRAESAAAQSVPPGQGAVVVSSKAGQRFEQTMQAGRHQITADEPVVIGGGDEGPSPYDLLLMALGACTSMTVKLYAERKQWPLEGVTVTLRHERLHGADCAACENGTARLERISRQLELHGPLSEAQRLRLMEIAEKCPVHRTLTSDLTIHTMLAPTANHLSTDE